MSRTCVAVAAVCVLLAAPAAGQDPALQDRFREMVWQIFTKISDEATEADERLRVTFRPARTTPLEGTDIYCEPLSSGLRDALHEGVQSLLDDMPKSPFDVVVANARKVSPPDVTISWAWDGAESVRVGAHVLLAGERGARYSASLPVSGLGEHERACLFAFRRGSGEVEARRAGVLREEPSDDATRFVRPFEAGETFLLVGELSTADENGAVWSVVLGEDPDRRGGFRNLFAPNLAGGAGGRKRDAAAFEAARRADTVSAYDRYLSEWPSGAHESEAQDLRAAAAERDREAREARIRDAAAFASARRSDTVSAYDRYLSDWSSGAHASEARGLRAAAAEREREERDKRARDAAAFASARRSDTVSAYDGYLSEWPSGAHASEARGLRAAAAAERERQERDAAAFAAARRSDTVSAYEEYLAAWPSGAHVSAARRFLEAARVPPVGSVFRDCAHCPEMVVVPSGGFTMGSPTSEEGRDDDEGPQRGVTIGSAFAVGVYEVTFAEWDACVSSGGCGGYRPDDAGWGRGQRPVIVVSWEDAQSYVGWLSRETGEAYRLLSESEWEYVARAGTVTRYWWGDGSSSQCRYANGADASSGLDWGVDCDDGYSRTSPVGSFEGNSFGLHDVHGNVWEWVEDCWNESYVGAPRDGSAWERGDCSRRVLRGGSWSSNPRLLRAAYRYRLDAGGRNDNAGFRVARAFTP